MKFHVRNLLLTIVDIHKMEIFRLSTIFAALVLFLNGCSLFRIIFCTIIILQASGWFRKNNMLLRLDNIVIFVEQRRRLGICNRHGSRESYSRAQFRSLKVGYVWDVPSSWAIRIVPVGAPHRRKIAHCFYGTCSGILSLIFRGPRMKRHLIDLFESRWSLRPTSKIHFHGRNIIFGRWRVDSVIGLRRKNELRLLKFWWVALRYLLDALFVYSVQIQLV